MPIDNFIQNIPTHLRELAITFGVGKFEFTYDEIDNVQEYFESEFSKSDNLESNNFVEQFYAYIGEAFRFYNGGRWEICSYKKDEAYGTPIIIDWGNDGFPHARISVYVWKEYLIRGLMDEKFTDIIRRSQIPMRED